VPAVPGADEPVGPRQRNEPAAQIHFQPCFE
jgi:hypothetical protein